MYVCINKLNLHYTQSVWPDKQFKMQNIILNNIVEMVDRLWLMIDWVQQYTLMTIIFL